MPKQLLAENPIRVHRLSFGLTMRELARKCGLQLNTILQLEAGMYADVLPAVESFLREQGISTITLNSEYHDFQRQARKQKFSRFSLVLPEHVLGKPPLQTFREHLELGQSEFYRMLGVNPGIANKAETAKIASLPKQIKLAFEQAGMDSDELEELDFRIREYYERHYVKS